MRLFLLLAMQVRTCYNFDMDKVLIANIITFLHVLLIVSVFAGIVVSIKVKRFRPIGGKGVRYLFLSVIVIGSVPEYGGGAFFPGPDRSLIGGVMAALFLLISLILIAWKWWKLRR